jgi:hypothetical protein
LAVKGRHLEGVGRPGRGGLHKGTEIEDGKPNGTKGQIYMTHSHPQFTSSSVAQGENLHKAQNLSGPVTVEKTVFNQRVVSTSQSRP